MEDYRAGTLLWSNLASLCESVILCAVGPVAMDKVEAPIEKRKFSRVDAKRALISLLILVPVGVCYWFLLPVVQSLIFPRTPGGTTGPWMVRPILAMHFCAVAAMTCVTAPIISRRLRRRWKREDATMGSRYDPFPGRRV